MDDKTHQTVQDWIEDNRDNNRTTLKILRQIASCLEEIHANNGVHGYLNPTSVVLNSDGEVVDIQFRPGNPAEEEALKNWRPAEEQTKAGDIFALGCLFVYILSEGQHPFGDPENRPVFIANNLYDLSRAPLEEYDLQTLIKKTINYDPSLRPNFAELKKHPLFWNTEKVEGYLVEAASSFLNNSVHKIWLNETFFAADDDGSTDSDEDSIQSVAEIMTRIKVYKFNEIYVFLYDY